MPKFKVLQTVTTDVTKICYINQTRLIIRRYSVLAFLSFLGLCALLYLAYKFLGLKKTNEPVKNIVPLAAIALFLTILFMILDPALALANFLFVVSGMGIFAAIGLLIFNLVKRKISAKKIAA